MAWTYIVKCRDGTFYVGSTIDLERRISEHNLGFGAAYTRRRRPVELVWAAEFGRLDEAFWFEKQIQGWGREKRMALIEGRLDDLPVLARNRQLPDGVSTSSTSGGPAGADSAGVSTGSTGGGPAGADSAGVSTGSTSGGPAGAEGAGVSTGSTSGGAVGADASRAGGGPA